MKIGQLQSYTYNPQKSRQKNVQKHPSFEAIVNIDKSGDDSISGKHVEYKGPIQRMAEKLAVVLENFDKNLIFDISGTKKSDSFFEFFEPATIGLKVKIKYFDQQKAYYDILRRSLDDHFLKETTLEGLRCKDQALLYQLTNFIGVGKYFRPNTENEDLYVEKLTNMISREIKAMPNRLLENKNIERRPDGTFAICTNVELKKGTDFRDTCSWYKGIEY